MEDRQDVIRRLDHPGYVTRCDGRQIGEIEKGDSSLFSYRLIAILKQKQKATKKIRCSKLYRFFFFFFQAATDLLLT